jgi:short-subunit dehydrogenase
VTADLTRPADVERLHREANAVRPLDVLAANAGIGSGGGSFVETDLELELKLVDLNVRSQVHLTKLVARDMAARGEGRILITSSIVGVMPGPFEAVYAASKAFLKSFGEAIRNELADKGVVVTLLMPGPTETDFFHRANMDNTPAGQAKKDDPAEVARQGYAALMKDRHQVIAASTMVKTQGVVSNLMSDPQLAKMSRKHAEPLTPSNDQDDTGGYIEDEDDSGSGIGGTAAFALGTLAVAGIGGGAAWWWSRQREGAIDDRTRRRLAVFSSPVPTSGPDHAVTHEVPTPTAADITIGA